MAIEGQAFEQGALAQLFGGIFSLAGRQIEPTVAGILLSKGWKGRCSRLPGRWMSLPRRASRN